ncbi:MAG: hypothetical protein ACI8WB_000487 [Phenylobacterium sp.]|jgi:hypothetical protein
MSREVDMLQNNTGKLNTDFQPANIIAVSTSPFDKFPLERNRQTINNYNYLGLRNLRAIDFGKAYNVISLYIFSSFNFRKSSCW